VRQTSVALFAPIDADKVEAKYDKGVLEITVPKKAEARTKPIQIQVKSYATLRSGASILRSSESATAKDEPAFA
jgi:hypothetical protein